MQSNINMVKMQKAKSLSNKLLKTAKKHLIANQKEAFFAAVSQAYYTYISNKLGIEISDLNKDHIVAELNNRNISQDNIQALVELTDTCDLVRYAPTAISLDMKEFFEKASLLLTNLEKEIG
jgi:predicted metal-binding protein